MMEPVNKELFERTAPKWNCVDYPNDGMHYVPDGDCLWCGMTREQIRAERTRNTYRVQCGGKKITVNADHAALLGEGDTPGKQVNAAPAGNQAVCFYNNDDSIVALFPAGTDFTLVEHSAQAKEEIEELKTAIKQRVDEIRAEKGKE